MKLKDGNDPKIKHKHILKLWNVLDFLAPNTKVSITDSLQTEVVKIKDGQSLVLKHDGWLNKDIMSMGIDKNILYIMIYR